MVLDKKVLLLSIGAHKNDDWALRASDAPLNIGKTAIQGENSPNRNRSTAFNVVSKLTTSKIEVLPVQKNTGRTTGRTNPRKKKDPKEIYPTGK